MTWPNGDRYDGEWFEGKKHGFGTVWRCEHGKHRVEYNGTWVHNKRDGYGVMHNEKGETMYSYLCSSGILVGAATALVDVARQ